MKKFLIDVTRGQKNTAGDKAKRDITHILADQGFNKIEVKIFNNKLQKLLLTRKEIQGDLALVGEGDLLLVQYPLYSLFELEVLLRICKARRIKLVGIIHDVECLRALRENRIKSFREISIFNKFDCLIVHNESMRQKLHLLNVRVKMISLEVFDYLNNNQMVKTGLNNSLVFAGNLGKAEFLDKWTLNLSVKLFGINPRAKYVETIKYLGVKSPNELPKFLSGSFGLVWDGAELTTNSGVFGEYTKYNNPHKVSLYLSCGLPVIVWKQAAISNFIKDKRVGLVIESLIDLPSSIQSLSLENYNEMCMNAKRVGTMIREGKFTKIAVDTAIDYLREKDQ